MTEILSVKVEGLAGRTTTVSPQLKSDVNIFFGMNGSGKTSLLKLIFSALQDDVSLIRRVPFERAFVTFSAPDLADRVVTRTITAQQVAQVPTTPSVVTVMSPTGPVQVPQFLPQRGWRSVDGHPVMPMACAFLSTSRLFGDPIGGIWISGNDVSPYSEARLDQQFLQLVMNRWAIYNNTLLSEVRDLQEQGIADVLGSFFSRTGKRPSAEALDADDAYRSVRHFIERRQMSLALNQTQFSDIYSEDPRLQRAVKTIQDAEDRIVEAERPLVALEKLVRQFVTTNKEISFGGGGGIEVRVAENHVIGIDALSSGEKQLLRILIECLSAPGNCLLIDEPELSLHIDWQRALISAMRTVNPNLQIVAATHSPEIMADSADDHIFEI